MKNLKANTLALVVVIHQDWTQYLSDRRFLDIDELRAPYQEGSITDADLKRRLDEIVRDWDEPTIGEFLDFLEILSEHDSRILSCLEPFLSQEDEFVRARRMIEWFNTTLEFYMDALLKL